MLTDTPAETSLHEYRALLLPRVIEDKMLRLIRQGRISKWFSGYGQEAIAVGCALALDDDDYVFPTHRNLGVWTTRDVPLKPLFCQLMGREGGYTKGRDRTFHFGLPEKRIVGMISHMAAMLPVACGVAYGLRRRGDQNVALAFCGDGASREGDFHEALNLASVWRLPVIFVVENNGYGLSTPTSEAMAVTELASAAAGYGMAGETIDGNHLGSVIEAVTRARARALRGEGPTLLEMKTFRVRGHEEASGTKYVPKELIEEWSGRDPVKSETARVVEDGLASEDELGTLRAELERLVDEAAEYALAQPEVTSSLDVERADVFEQGPGGVEPTGPRTNKRYIDAVSDALRQSMEADERIVLFGQDIAGYGGVFKVTQGFVEQFGSDRVRNTPIIESGAVGAAMGASLTGLKPVLEMQYADFITCGFNQIVSNLATTRYRWGQQVDVTVRAPYGGNIGAGPFHSQSVEAWFAHVPGLKVVVPGTPQDAKGLLMAAIKDPNPVIVFEHKFLYRALRGDVTDAPFSLPIGAARIEREGADLTIVTWGLGLLWAVEEAERRSTVDGVSIEVVDLRTVHPWDRETVLGSVRKTGRLIVVHEAARTGGFGGEVASTIAEEAFEFLDAPPVRVGGADIPIPFSTQLEREVYSAHARLGKAIDRVLEY